MLKGFKKTSDYILKAIEEVSLFGVLFLIFSSLSISLGFELYHNFSLSNHISEYSETIDLTRKSCDDYVKLINEQNADPLKVGVAHTKCALSNFPEISNVIADLENTSNIQKHSESINSTLSSIMTLISMFLAAIALLSLNLYKKFKRLIKETETKINESIKEQLIRNEESEKILKNKIQKYEKLIRKSLKNQQLKTEISEQLIQAKIEIHDEIKNDTTPSNAMAKADRCYHYLQLLLTKNHENHKEAHKILRSSFYSIHFKENFPEFIKLLDLIKFSNLAIDDKYLNAEDYFMDKILVAKK